MYSRCPGQDSRRLRAEIHKCPSCGHEVEIFSDEVKVLEQLEKKVEKQIKETIGTTCKCKLVEPKSIQRSEGKAKRVTDKRNM